MKNLTLFNTILPNIPSYCGSLGYFLDASKAVRAKLHLNFTYQSLAILAFALA